VTNNVLEPFQNFLRIAKPSRTDISFPITNISDESNYDLEKNDLEVEKKFNFQEQVNFQSDISFILEIKIFLNNFFMLYCVLKGQP